MILFIVGVFEMILVGLWTKWIVDARVAATGLVTMVHFVIWYYVLQTIVSHLSDWKLAAFYGLGCTVGSMISAYYADKLPYAKKRTKKAQKNDETIAAIPAALGVATVTLKS